MSIADKLVTIAENEQKVYKAGYDSAVREGTTTLFTGFSQVFTISGLPSLPKTFTILGLNSNSPIDDNQYFVGSLNYINVGFDYSGGDKKDISIAIWARVTKNVSSGKGTNGSIRKQRVEDNKIVAFENGTFTIDLSKHNSTYGFGTNYKYKWIATF